MHTYWSGYSMLLVILHICRQSIHSVTVTVQIKEKKITYINKFRMIVLQLIARKEMRKLFADLRVLFTHNEPIGTGSERAKHTVFQFNWKSTLTKNNVEVGYRVVLFQKSYSIFRFWDIMFIFAWTRFMTSLQKLLKSWWAICNLCFGMAGWQIILHARTNFCHTFRCCRGRSPCKQNKE